MRSTLAPAEEAGLVASRPTGGSSSSTRCSRRRSTPPLRHARLREAHRRRRRPRRAIRRSGHGISRSRRPGRTPESCRSSRRPPRHARDARLPGLGGRADQSSRSGCCRRTIRRGWSSRSSSPSNCISRATSRLRGRCSRSCARRSGRRPARACAADARRDRVLAQRRVRGARARRGGARRRAAIRVLEARGATPRSRCTPEPSTSRRRPRLRAEALALLERHSGRRPRPRRGGVERARACRPLPRRRLRPRRRRCGRSRSRRRAPPAAVDTRVVFKLGQWLRYIDDLDGARAQLERGGAAGARGGRRVVARQHPAQSRDRRDLGRGPRRRGGAGGAHDRRFGQQGVGPGGDLWRAYVDAYAGRVESVREAAAKADPGEPMVAAHLEQVPRTGGACGRRCRLRRPAPDGGARRSSIASTSASRRSGGSTATRSKRRWRSATSIARRNGSARFEEYAARSRIPWSLAVSARCRGLRARGAGRARGGRGGSRARRSPSTSAARCPSSAHARFSSRAGCSGG